MNKDEFIESIEEYPTWVKTKNDALVFASHLNYRMQQIRAKYNLLYAMIEEKDSEFIGNEMLLKLLEVHNEYDDAYNNRVHPLSSIEPANQILTIVKQ